MAHGSLTGCWAGGGSAGRGPALPPGSTVGWVGPRPAHSSDEDGAGGCCGAGRGVERDLDGAGAEGRESGEDEGVGGAEGAGGGQEQAGVAGGEGGGGGVGGGGEQEGGGVGAVGEEGEVGVGAGGGGGGGVAGARGQGEAGAEGGAGGWVVVAGEVEGDGGALDRGVLEDGQAWELGQDVDAWVQGEGRVVGDRDALVDAGGQGPVGADRHPAEAARWRCGQRVGGGQGRQGVGRRGAAGGWGWEELAAAGEDDAAADVDPVGDDVAAVRQDRRVGMAGVDGDTAALDDHVAAAGQDRKSTRLNSSHVARS